MPPRRIVVCALAALSALGFGGCSDSDCQALGQHPLGQILGALVGCTGEKVASTDPAVSLLVLPLNHGPFQVGEEVTLHPTPQATKDSKLVVGVEWDFNGDGAYEAGVFTGPRPSALRVDQLGTTTRYMTPGMHQPVVRITDRLGATGTDSTSLQVGYTPPDDQEPGGRLTDPHPAPAGATPGGARPSVSRAALPAGERLAFAVLAGRRARVGGVPALRGRSLLRYAQPGPLLPGADASPPPAVQKFLEGRWTLTLRRRRGSARGLAAVRMGKRRVGCARVRIVVPRNGLRTGTLTLLGGTGAAARLALRWSFELGFFGDGSIRMGGAISYQGRRKARGPTAACRRLAGLGPRRSS